MSNIVLNKLNIASFCRMQFLLPVSYLFYMENGISTGDFFLFQAIFTMCWFLLGIPIGYVSDYFCKKNILIFSFLLLIAKTCLWMSFKGYWVILLGEVLCTLSKSIYGCNCGSYIYQYLNLINGKKNMNNLMLKKYSTNNFFTSLSIALISLIGSVIYARFGYMVSLIMELIFLLIGLTLVITIPKINHFRQNNDKLSKKYKDLFKIVKETLCNKNYNKFIMYTALFGGSTLVLSNNFQPLMKFSELPVEIFGVVFFINYILRAMSGICSSFLLKYFSLNKITNITGYCFILSTFCLGLSYIINNKIFTFCSIFLTCITIFFEVVYYYITETKIHTQVDNNIRSTAVSVASTSIRFCATAGLLLFKFAPNTNYIKYLLFGYLLIFIYLFFAINKNKNEYKF